MKTLEELMARIANVWQCDPSRYPELAGMSEEQRRNFLVKHSILHITKTNGKLAALCEDYDHNQKMSVEDEENLRVAATKMFVNAVKLAEESGLTAEELLARAPNYVK